eukprot:TRINITY_DN33638_c0_g1_i1.p2 TRINITY_DN33638_c0_g1~~TRINITY_DN33638_c0_g1_i1.p2  ORF type:complete len:136 (+),score=32.63 TRINITY_DN33638_c0_g1_i1:68-475(+)
MAENTDIVPSSATKPAAALLVLHGIFLAACGCYGAHSHGWKKEVMHSAYAGLGGCGALTACALLTASGKRKLTAIGVHVALLLQLVFTGVFALQAKKSYGDPKKADRFPLFVVMCLGSVTALGGMLICKPKKKKE